MPSVEMRRTTRVFGARVLRSGRRLLNTPEVYKHMRRAPLAVANAEQDWIALLDHAVGGDGSCGDVESKRNGWRNSEVGIDKNVMDINGGKSGNMLVELKEDGLIENGELNGDLGTNSSHCGLVYTRKRKRSPVSISDNLDKKYGIKFSRKRSRKMVNTETQTVNTEPQTVNTEKQTANTEKQPSDLLQIVTIKPSLAPKSKSRKRKGRKILVTKRKQLNAHNLRPRSNITVHHGIQKRRSSLRSRKQRNLSSVGHLKSSGGLVQDNALFFPIRSTPEVSRSIRRISRNDVKEVIHDIDSASCNASILVIESDRCYREVGAVITMEMVGPNQWFLVVRKDGVERFRVEPRNLMKPCFCNRVTNAIIWAGGDESWKLEFPVRQDWLIFKELYRKCSERTIRIKASLSSIIPVPRVSEVQGYAEEKYVPFNLPDSYICSRGDEVSRVLEKSDSVYDMDSDDDEWLNKFNSESDAQIDNDTFEKIIDAFERGIYGSQEDYSDVSLAVDRCLMLASKEVLEVVYDYWMTKRKKKDSALVRVFQLYKPINSERPNFKGVLRKKRSFRQRGNQTGRGKQITFLKALCERNKAEEAENARIKVHQTEAAANRAEMAAIMKRQRAQLLMEVADLLTYKAAMSLKIAEARASFGSVDVTIDGTLFFGD